MAHNREFPLSSREVIALWMARAWRHGLKNRTATDWREVADEMLEALRSEGYEVRGAREAKPSPERSEGITPTPED